MRSSQYRYYLGRSNVSLVHIGCALCEQQICRLSMEIERKTSEPVTRMSWTAISVVVSILLFVLAGILEVGGGYAIWIAVREKRNPALFIPVGCITLIVYGFVPTLQPISSFGRIFAVYGGFFILLSYLWAYLFDGFKFDNGDVIGTCVALVGVCICWFWPRD